MKYTDKSLLKMNNLTESLYKKYGFTSLNEMALNEMPQIKTQTNSYTSHIQAAKNILAQINNLEKNPQKDDVNHVYKLISYNLDFDVENNAKSWRANGVNTDSLCKTYDKCIKAFGDLYEKVLGNTSYWDKKYFELYDLLHDLEVNSGLGTKYSRKLANESHQISEDYGEDKYSLVGQDGNAFALMGYTARCMKECGLRNETDEMRRRATESNYDNLVRVCDEYVQRCNDIARNGFEESLNEDMYDDLKNKPPRYAVVTEDGSIVSRFHWKMDAEDCVDYWTEHGVERGLNEHTYEIKQIENGKIIDLKEIPDDDKYICDFQGQGFDGYDDEDHVYMSGYYDNLPNTSSNIDDALRFDTFDEAKDFCAYTMSKVPNILTVREARQMDSSLEESLEEDFDLPIDHSGEFAGWIAQYQGKKIEIKKSEANGIYEAKQIAIEKLKVPKSKVGLLSIQPAYDYEN